MALQESIKQKTTPARAHRGGAAPLALALLLASAAPAPAQRLLSWPVRTGAGAEALLPGAAAVFWNPAATAVIEGRAEGLLLQTDGPDVTGLGGVALAGALRPTRRMTAALGYDHFSIDGIPRTSTSPNPDSADGEVAIAEDELALASARELLPGLWGGATLRYWWTSRDAGGDRGLAAGLGVHYRLPLPIPAALGGALFTGAEAGPRWLVGVEGASAPIGAGGPSIGLSYGLRDGGSGREHRAVVSAHWRGRFQIAAGVAGGWEQEPGAWEPVLAASVRLGRYSLAIVREELANGFGASHAYRFNVLF